MPDGAVKGSLLGGKGARSFYLWHKLSPLGVVNWKLCQGDLNLVQLRLKMDSKGLD
jgi:hypothetical protein